MKDIKITLKEASDKLVESFTKTSLTFTEAIKAMKTLQRHRLNKTGSKYHS